MSSNINNFISSFKTDAARPSRFDVSIPIPISMIPFLGTSKNLTYRCESAELPSRTFSTAEQKFGSSPVEKYPYFSNYNDTSMTFIVSDDMSEKIFFEYWMDYINPTYKYDFRYKSDYTTTMKVNQYDVNGDLSYSINLIDAFPVSVNQLDLDWSHDGYHKLVVTFAYSYWQNNSLEYIGSSLIQSGLAGLTDMLGGLGESFGTVGDTVGGILPTTPTTIVPQGPSGPMSLSSLPTATNRFNSLISGNRITNLPNSPL